MKVRILAGPADAQGNKPAVGIELENLPKSGIQKLRQETIENLSQWIDETEKGFLFKTVSGDVRFEILQPPGCYCLTCGEQLPAKAGNGTDLEARRAVHRHDHVATHGKEAVTTARWPHGYSNMPNTFTCRVSDQRGG